MTLLPATCLFVLLALASPLAAAQAPAGADPAGREAAGTAAPVPAPVPAGPGSDPAIPELEAIVVSGVLPGPGLWQVERDGRVLWVLATVSPLPRRMQWNADEVEQRIGESGIVLLPPTARLEAGGARFGGVFLLPALMKARNNPDGGRLEGVLPPADLARWQRLKARYLGRDRGVEKRRPILAAMSLREAAFADADLSQRDIVGRVVERAARRAGVPRLRPSVTLVIGDAKATLKQFAGSTLDDLPCFRRTLDQVEHDLDTLALRANAWALGDLAMLDRLPYTDNAQACMDALLGTGLAREKGLARLPARIAAAWVADAEAALAAHPRSFAVLPLRLVTGPEAFLPMLQARGYTVRAPDTGHTMPP